MHDIFDDDDWITPYDCNRCHGCRQQYGCNRFRSKSHNRQIRRIIAKEKLTAKLERESRKVDREYRMLLRELGDLREHVRVQEAELEARRSRLANFRLARAEQQERPPANEADQAGEELATLSLEDEKEPQRDANE